MQTQRLQYGTIDVKVGGLNPEDERKLKKAIEELPDDFFQGEIHKSNYVASMFLRKGVLRSGDVQDEIAIRSSSAVKIPHNAFSIKAALGYVHFNYKDTEYFVEFVVNGR